MKLYYATLGLACLLGSTTSAFGWDPNAGADDMPTNVTYRFIPAYKPAPSTAVVYQVTTPAPAAPVVTAAPITPAPVAYVPPPPPIYVAPTPAPSAYPAAPVADIAAPTAYAMPITPEAAAYNNGNAPIDAYPYGRKNRYSLGVEGFYDRYQEPAVTVDSRTGYGSLDGSWQHYFAPEWFGELDGRGSYGKEHYHSDSGTIDSINNYEFDGRVLFGYDADYLHGRHFKPYLGLGDRYYMDEGKGKVTELDKFAYDRRINQLYLPVGVTYDFPSYGLDWSTNLEFDPLLWGHVDTRLQNLPGYPPVINEQHGGNGVRGDILVGQLDSEGRGWQLGPFFRYWNMDDSQTAVDQQHAGYDYYEPHNTRWQLGATAKFLF